MGWFSNLLQKLAGTSQEVPAVREAEQEMEPINLDELSDGARAEIMRLQKNASRSDLTLTDLRILNEQMDAIVEQDRRSREFTRHDWPETTSPAAARAARKATQNLSDMSLEELRALDQRLTAEGEWNEREAKLQATKRWGAEAGRPMGKGPEVSRPPVEVDQRVPTEAVEEEEEWGQPPKERHL